MRNGAPRGRQCLRISVRRHSERLRNLQLSVTVVGQCVMKIQLMDDDNA